MIGGLAVAIVLLGANGFFVAAEFALVAARRSRIEQLAAEGDVRAQVVARSLRELSFMLSAAQLGITMASLGLGYVAEPAVASLLEPPVAAVGLPEGVTHTVSFLVALTVVVFLHMVIGEMVPKNVAIARPDVTALRLAVPMRAYTTAFRPLIRLLNVLANAGVRLFGVEPRDEMSMAHTGEEIAGMLAVSRGAGVLEEDEHRLMSGALGFPDRQVAAVMVPRSQVVAVRAGASVEEVERVAVERGHSRLPVFGRDLDEVLGFLHAKDLLRLDPPARRRPLPRELVRRMLVVPESAGLQEVLVDMRRARLHFAVVVGQGGATTGIVTLEDVLEQLVGDIRDEHDVTGPAANA